MTSSHHKERNEAIRALVAKLNEMYPDPEIPNALGRTSSTQMRAMFASVICEIGARGGIYKNQGWIDAYNLCGWPPEETINLLSLILEE